MMRYIILFFMFPSLACAFNTESVALAYKAYNTPHCYNTDAECFTAPGRCGFCMHFDQWNDPGNEYCWPSLPQDVQQRYYENVMGLKSGAVYTNWNACDGYSYFMQWQVVPASDSCGSYTLNNAWVGYDANIYSAWHDPVSPGVWQFTVWNWRDNVPVSAYSVLDKYDMDIWDWVTTGQGVADGFDAQSFIGASPVGSSYRVDFQPVGTSCSTYDYFSHYYWDVYRVCKDNAIWVTLYDYAGWTSDYLDAFSIDRYQDLKGTGPVVLYKTASYGYTGPLERNYKYKIDYTTWDGINYVLDFVPLCQYVENPGDGVLSVGGGVARSGSGVKSQAVGGYETRY